MLNRITNCTILLILSLAVLAHADLTQQPSLVTVPTGGSGGISPYAYHAKLDGVICKDITASNSGVGGAVQITSTLGCANFNGRVGEYIGLYVLGGTRQLDSTIASVQSATVATLASTAAAPGGTLGAVYGNDDGTLTNNYINSWPINSTFTIQMPSGPMLITSVPINFNGRNVNFLGSASMIGGGSNVGVNSAVGSLLVPIFVNAPSPPAVVYMPNTWDARLQNWVIVPDGLYANTLALVQSKKITLANSNYPATFNYLDGLTLGATSGGTGTQMADSALYGVLVSAGQGQNDRGQIGRIVTNSLVYGLSFCGDAGSHPFGCQGVAWQVGRITCNRDNTCIDSSHGGVANRINEVEDLSSGVTFQIGDGAVLSVKDLTAEHDGNQTTIGIPWTATTPSPRDITYTSTNGGPCFLQVTTSGTTGGSPPACPGLGMTVTDGGATETQVANPVSLMATFLGTGGSPGGNLNMIDSAWDMNGWLPASGDIISSNSQGYRFQADRFYLASDVSNPPSGSQRFDLALSGASYLDFTCRNCMGMLSSYLAPSASGGDNRNIEHILLTRPSGFPGGSTGDTGDYLEEWLVNGAALAINQSDKPGKETVKGGPLAVNQLSAPASIFSTTCAPTPPNSNQYRYKVTATSGSGETNAPFELTKGSCCVIGAGGCTVTGQFMPVVGADSYKLYRTQAGGSSGTETYVETITINNIVSPLGSNSFSDSATDMSISGNPAVPTLNTTGNLTVGSSVVISPIAAAVSGGGTAATGSSGFIGTITSAAATGNVITPGFTCPNKMICLLSDQTTAGGAKVTGSTTTTCTFSATASDTVDYVASCR